MTVLCVVEGAQDTVSNMIAAGVVACVLHLSGGLSICCYNAWPAVQSMTAHIAVSGCCRLYAVVPSQLAAHAQSHNALKHMCTTSVHSVSSVILRPFALH